MSYTVIATNFARSTHTEQLIQTAQKVSDVVLVHTLPDLEERRGCINIVETERSYPVWINRGLEVCSGPTLVLNDDLVMTRDLMVRLIKRLENADMAVIPKMGGVTPISGYAFGLRPEKLRFNQDYRWWYSDDDMWMRAVTQGMKISTVPGTVVHDRQGRPSYPRDLTMAVRADRALFARTWRNGDRTGLPG